jgi:hypothetical protein
VGSDFHEMEQVDHAGGLLMEAVGGNAFGNGGAGVGSAGGDDVDLGVESAHHGEQLEAGHAGHVQVGQEDVGCGGADHLKRSKAIPGGADGEAAQGEDLGEKEARVELIVNNQQIGTGFRHHEFLPVEARAGSRLSWTVGGSVQ